MSHSILILCPDVITECMAGPAIRYWEFAKVLSPLFQVTLAAPNVIPNALQALTQAHLIQHTSKNIAKLTNQHDIIIFQGHILENYPLLRQTNKILVADLYDPIVLESLEQCQDPHTITAQVRLMNSQIKHADYFICASERQRDLWLGHLLALGRINLLTINQIQQRMIIVPFGIPDMPPQRTGIGLRKTPDDNDKFILLWGGGIWEWFDPLILIRAVYRLKSRYPDLRLVFLGTQHPNPKINIMPKQHRAEALASELGVHGNQVIFKKGWVPYDTLHNHLLDADVGVSAHFDTLETHFSFRTRLLSYFWAGKPIITTTGDVLAEEIIHKKAGIVVNPTDEEAWIRAIENLHNPEQYATYINGVKTLAQQYRWSTVIQPLLNLCSKATRSPDISDRTIILPNEDYNLKKQLATCEHDKNVLKKQVNSIMQSFSMQITAPLRTLRRCLKK